MKLSKSVLNILGETVKIIENKNIVWMNKNECNFKFRTEEIQVNIGKLSKRDIDKHYSNESTIFKKIPVVGFSRPIDVRDGKAVSKIWLFGKNLKKDILMIILCHEVGHLIHFFYNVSGNLLEYDKFFQNRKGIINSEVAAWRNGVKLYKNISNNVNTWYKVRKTLLNSYYLNGRADNKNHLNSSNNNSIKKENPDKLTAILEDVKCETYTFSLEQKMGNLFDFQP